MSGSSSQGYGGITRPNVGNPYGRSPYGGQSMQPMQMFQAWQQGAGWDQVNRMNPVQQQQPQFLPPSMPTFQPQNYYSPPAQQQPAAAPAALLNPGEVAGGDSSGGDSGGGGGGGK